MLKDPGGPQIWHVKLTLQLSWVHWDLTVTSWWVIVIIYLWLEVDPSPQPLLFSAQLLPTFSEPENQPTAPQHQLPISMRQDSSSFFTIKRSQFIIEKHTHMYMLTHIHTHVSIYTHSHKHFLSFTYICAYICIHTFSHKFMLAHMHTHVPT